jgi:pimeloyl-ACP methyl ester carboxylesterase
MNETKPELLQAQQQTAQSAFNVEATLRSSTTRMRSRRSGVKIKCRMAASFGCALLLPGLCGCAHLATVRTKPAKLPRTLVAETPLESASRYVAAAEHEPPLGALADDLLAARTSYSVLALRPNDDQARSLYNFAVARAVEKLERANLQPWRQPIDVVTDEGNYILTCPKPADPEHDPDRYDLFPTDTLRIGGKFFESRSTVDGIGAPLVAVGRAENPQFRQQYKLRRVYASVTALIKFNGRRAELDFVDPLMTERTALGNHVFPLAADFNASTAMLMARERPERIGFARVLRPEAYADTARLFQLQQFDETRTPVIFVHGLQDTPAGWAPMINSLRDDPWIRKHYQFWVFSYPSGYPYPYSAMLLRQNLDGIARAFPNRKSIILVGHSMGGMIGRLMITDAGDKIWREFFATSPAKTPLRVETRRVWEKSLVFDHRAEIKRVIFISTPHRGSSLASGWIGRVGSALVRAPRFMTSVYAGAKPLFIADPAAHQLNRVPNSVDTLEPNDRFVLAVNKLPLTPGIPCHSIIGDRGRGDTPNSSDGVVPYWSSHIDGAQSELIVPSAHPALRNAEAIKEVERILKTCH